MPTRQKQLLIALAVAVLCWQGGGWVWQLVFGPIAQLRQQLVQAQERVDTKTDRVIAIEQAKVKIRNWQARSLPPDPGKKKRPDAVEAQRQYSEWLTELAHTVGFEELSVVPQRRSISRNNVYVEVVVQIDGFGRLSQVYELLDRFYRTDLLHRISRLQLTADDVVGDPPVRFSLEAGGLALADAKVRRTLFPKTSLAEDLAPMATQLVVTTADEFLKDKVPFEVRVEQELLNIREISETRWTIERGLERTARTEHPQKSTITLVPINKSVEELSPTVFRELVRTNPFVKPTPPIDYEMIFGPFSTQIVVRGEKLELTLTAKDYDPARGEPKYQMSGKIPAGLSLQEETGKLVWKPASQLAAGEYPLQVTAVHPSAPGGKLTEELELKLVEANSPPKISPLARQSVYRGQTFQLQIAATDKDDPPQTLTYQLAADAPPGCEIDASSGELNWTPATDQPLEAVNLVITVTDTGTPPRTATVSVTVDVKDDTAQTTKLIGIVVVNDQSEAWFYDQSSEKKTMLQVGETLRAAEIEAEIVNIEADVVTVRIKESNHRLKLGDTIRSLMKTPQASQTNVTSPGTSD